MEKGDITALGLQKPPEHLTSIMPNLKINGMKRSLPVVLVFLFTSACGEPEGTATSTASRAERTTRQTPSQVPDLRIRTYHGCESVPAQAALQRLFVGFELTGESCSVAVVAGNSVRVSFMDDDIVPLSPYPSPDGNFNSDILIGELENSDVLIVQHDFNGHVYSVTQTIRDSSGALVYGRSGSGDYIKECLVHQENRPRTCGRPQDTPPPEAAP